MTSSNPNSPTNSPLNFRPFALTKGRKFRFMPANSVLLSKPVITQALQTGGDAIQVIWGESGGTSYALQVSTDGGTSFSALTTTSGTSYTHTGLSFPGSYTYRVRATADGSDSDWSDNVTETMVDVPAAPGGLTVTGATTSSISLSWNDTADESYYLVESSVDGLGSWSSAGTSGQNVVTFTHTGLSESVQRYYRVMAVNKAGGSIPSSTANSWTVPAAPTGLTATATSSTQVDLSWTDVSTGNQSYKVERSTDNSTWTEIATGLSGTATTYSATGLSASTLYYFRVRAANAAQNSAYSSSASATTQSGGALSPSWTLDYSTGTPSGYTLTRASTGTFVDSSGYIASASIDAARLTHNSSGSRLGLLVEGAGTNNSIQSEDMSSGWNPTNVTITTNSVSAPDNQTTADLLLESTANAEHIIYRLVSGMGSGSIVLSAFVKKQNRSQVLLQLGGNGAPVPRVAQLFDIDAGVKVGSILTNGSPTSTNSGIDDFGNGWFRVWVTGASMGGFGNPIICISNQTGNTPPTYNASNQPTYTGNTANGLYVWGVQVEAGNWPTSYIPTAGSSVTRSADLAHVLDSSITSWGDPGALVIHFYPPGRAGTLISTDDASTAQVGIEASSTTAARAFWSSGSTSTGTIGSGVQKAVHYWTGSTSKFCINGGTVQSGTNNLTIANTDFVTLGAEATDSGGAPSVFSQYANCVIRKVEFYSGTLTDANLQTITT